MADALRRSIGALRVVGVCASFWYLYYQVQLRSGWFRWGLPVRTWKDVYGELTRRRKKEIRGNPPPFFFKDLQAQKRQLREIHPIRNEPLEKEIQDLRRGRYRLWGDALHHLGFPPTWNTNPLTGRRQAADRHWTEIPELATGDIKGLWEASRFGCVFPLVRWYVYTEDRQAPETFWQLVESWLAENPPQCGPQWLSAQEVGLRAMAWIFGLRAFTQSEATTEERVFRLTAALGEHARRIMATLAYARAQNNNHLISEAAALFTIGMQCPDLPGAKKWLRTGRSLLIESSAQLFPDGGYIQHSHNYHRLVLQLYLWSFRLADLAGDPFPRRMHEKFATSVYMLYRQVHGATGRVPNFGHNDGTLFLPLSPCGFEDYRPVLQSCLRWIEGHNVLPRGPWDEEADWMNGRLGGTEERPADRLVTLDGLPGETDYAYPQAGLYLIRGAHSHAWIRCAEFHNRPAHADQLHVDLWMDGENIACDAGSFLYSGAYPWRNPFAHAAVHNTVTVDGRDHMQRTGRFRWDTLAQGTVFESGEGLWRGGHSGYWSIGVEHRRSVKRMGNGDWAIMDDVRGREVHTVRLHWLIPDYRFSVEDVQKEPGPDLTTEARNFIETVTSDSTGRILQLESPAGDIFLHIWSNRTLQWSLYRGGKAVWGEEETNGPVPPEVRGWRSIRYAAKIPALSLAVIARYELPIRFVSIWKLPGG